MHSEATDLNDRKDQPNLSFLTPRSETGQDTGVLHLGGEGAQNEQQGHGPN